MKDFLNSMLGQIISGLTILALILALITETIMIYRTKSEANIAEQKALVELEAARNANLLKRAEAAKLDAEATSARETANNAERLRVAEAEERVQIAKKATAEVEIARAAADNAGRLKLAEANEKFELAKKAAFDAEAAKELAKKAAADAVTAAAVAKNSDERQEAERRVQQALADKEGADARILQHVECDIAPENCTAEQRKGLTGRLATDLTNAVLPRSLGGKGNRQQEAEAPANAELPPKCRQYFADWQGYNSHSAFAVYGASDCVWSRRDANDRNFRSADQAVAALKTYCNQKNWACTIIATK